MKKDNALYFDCGSGVSGDMALGALIHVGADADAITRALKTLEFTAFSLEARSVRRNGVTGVSVNITTRDETPHAHDPGGAPHDHTSYRRIVEILDGSRLSGRAKHLAKRVYRAIAEAESRVHGGALEDATFHEVGSARTLYTITGCAVAADLIGATAFASGPVCDGKGHIECSHGLIPVPVPAVLELFKQTDIPLVVDADVTTEMVTPSGLGILVGFGASYAPRAPFKPLKTGYGFGTRDTGRFGAVRVLLGEA
jgi:uncharacterized protein (DUF111 family)